MSSKELKALQREVEDARAELTHYRRILRLLIIGAAVSIACIIFGAGVNSVSDDGASLAMVIVASLTLPSCVGTAMWWFWWNNNEIRNNSYGSNYRSQIVGPAQRLRDAETNLARWLEDHPQAPSA